jgi:Tol biopolymer transport system component
MDFLLPAPSKDGKKLFVLGVQPHGELVRYDRKSNQFVPYLSGISAYALDFSKDARWVAYATYPEATLWRSRLDGSQRLQLTPSSMRVNAPRWSPDGKRIAFVGAVPGRPLKIYTVSPDGGTPLLLLPGDRNESMPGWSPDGNSLVFGREPFLEGMSSGTIAIHIVDLRTHQVSTLPGSEGLFYPNWSPDGRYLAAITADNTKLLLYDFMRQNWVELAGRPIGSTNWSKSGEYIYFGSIYSAETNLYRLRIGDRKLERLMTLKGVRLAEPVQFAVTVAIPLTGLAPDDSPLLLRDVGSQELYALDVEFP